MTVMSVRRVVVQFGEDTDCESCGTPLTKWRHIVIYRGVQRDRDGHLWPRASSARLECGNCGDEMVVTVTEDK